MNCSTVLGLNLTDLLTEVVIILLLPVLLESFQVLLRQRLLLDGHSWDLIEEIQEGVGVDVTGHHVDVILHHFDVGHGSLVQRGVGVKQLVQELPGVPRLKDGDLYDEADQPSPPTSTGSESERLLKLSSSSLLSLGEVWEDFFIFLILSEIYFSWLVRSHLVRGESISPVYG